MPETISLNQLAKESRLGKQKLRTMLRERLLRGHQDTTGRKTIWIDRASAVEAGILVGHASPSRPEPHGTIDAAFRTVISDELEPVITLLTDRTSDVDNTALIAAIDRAEATLMRIEAVLQERLPRHRKRRWWFWGTVPRTSNATDRTTRRSPLGRRVNRAFGNPSQSAVDHLRVWHRGRRSEPWSSGSER